MADDVTLTIDGTTVTVPAGTLIVEAAKRVETDVPVYCYHPKLGPAGLCRICLVDVEKAPKLQIACNTAVTEGMVVHTRGQKVEDGRRAVMEFLLLNHPLDCPICDKGGECDLQDFSMAYGRGNSRLADAKAQKPKAIDLGPTIVLDDERCIVCQRCSRFDEIITNERSLVVKDRGQRDVISTATGEPYRSNFSGNVTELCPVGALTSKTYRFKSRPWDNVRTETTCTQCAVGCKLNVDERYGNVQRTMSVPDDDEMSDGWLCDRGRYDIGFYADERRVTSPLLRSGDDWIQLSWDDAIALWAQKLREAIAQAGPESVGAIGGARLLSEEIVVLERTMRGLGVRHLDWRAGRQRQATPGRFSGALVDLERAQAIVAIGRPPSQTAPVMDLRIRKAVTRGGARYATAGVHAAESFVNAGRVEGFEGVAAALAGFSRVAFVWDGIDLELGARAAATMDEIAASGASVFGYIASEQSNARGAERFGLVPRDGGADVAGMLGAARAGALRVLQIFGANPVLSHPGGTAATRAALANVPFVVATELFMTETASLANLVLPALGAFEKSGHTYAATGEIQSVRAGHVAPLGPLADGEMLVALADELGVAIPTPDELETLATTPLAASTFAFGDDSFGPKLPAANADPGGLRVAVAADIMAGGGTSYFDERFAPLRPRASATLAPETAAALALAEGDLVDLAAANGASLSGLTVRIDRGALAKVVRIVDGLPEAPASAFRDGDAVTLARVALATAGGIA